MEPVYIIKYCLSHFALKDTIKTSYFINISDELKRTKSLAKLRSVTATYPHLYQF